LESTQKLIWEEKMVAYAVVQLHVHDPSWIEGYLPPVAKLVEAHGGRYLASSQAPDHLEGESAVPSVSVIIEFPSVDAAKAFYADPGYAPHLEARLAGSSGDFWLMEGL
jgi:uncharacterized protein (DUF1330 family)